MAASLFGGGPGATEARAHRRWPCAYLHVCLLAGSRECAVCVLEDVLQMCPCLPEPGGGSEPRGAVEQALQLQWSPSCPPRSGQCSPWGFLGSDPWPGGMEQDRGAAQRSSRVASSCELGAACVCVGVPPRHTCLQTVKSRQSRAGPGQAAQRAGQRMCPQRHPVVRCGSAC